MLEETLDELDNLSKRLLVFITGLDKCVEILDEQHMRYLKRTSQEIGEKYDIS